MTHIQTFIVVVQAILSLFTPVELSTLNVNIENWIITKSEITVPFTGTNIVCVGDSNTAGTTGFTASKRYCDMLGINHPELSVYNAGFTTLTSTDLITRNVTEVYPHKVVGKRNIATLLIGTNDYYFSHTLTQSWGDIQTVIANLKGQGFEVVVMTYPPRITDTQRNIYLRSLNSIILTNAPILGYKTVDIAIEIVDPTNQDNAKSGMLLPDLLHLTEQGHQTVYEKLNTALGFTGSVSITSTGTTSTGTTSSGTYAVVSTTDKASEIIVSGNTISSTTNAWKSVRSSIGKSSGKWYWEVKNETNTNKYWIRGIGKSTAILTDRVGIDANGNAWYNDGSSSLKYTSNSPVNYGWLANSGDIIGFALDMDAGTITAYKNGVSQWVMYSWLSGTYFPMASIYGAGPTITFNFWETPFAYTVPSGYNAWIYQ